jgi:CRP/FNR family transcriptional regulator, cyclic AMP receptor protein
MANSFFNYSDSNDGRDSQELVFLPQWDEARWQKLLGYCEVRSFESGDIVIAYDDPGRSFYIILEGRLEVLLPRGDGTWRSTYVNEAGTVIGEQSFLDGRPRSALLSALSDGRLLCISQDSFQSFAAREPDLARDILADLARTLSLKLRRANHLIATWLK